MNNKLKNIIFYLVLFVLDFILISFVICKIDRLLYYNAHTAIVAFLISSFSVGIVAIFNKNVLT